MERQTYTIEEAGTLLGLSRNSVYKAAHSGTLPTVRIGFRLLVPKAALDRMLRHGTPAIEREQTAEAAR
jgi:excisionase family DNA binding protein